MGKIYILMGKSASGKDTLYKELSADEELKLKPYVGYTTRPRRSGEEEGREYFFCTEEQMKAYEAEGRLIEKRVYHTVHGDWYYFSVDREDLDIEEQDYICIGTLESYMALRQYYGPGRVEALYIEVEDGLRLSRALERERSQEQPKYAELCRRFLGDEKDFSPENLKNAGIEESWINDSLKDCVIKIKNKILAHV